MCFLLLLMSTDVWAGVVKHYDVRHGLFNNQSRMVIAMPDRRMLVYVDGMFSLFDGNRFQNLSVDRAKRVRVRSFLNMAHYFDCYGRLWVRYYHDLYVLDARTYEFLDAKALLRPSGLLNSIETFFVDEDGNAWVLTKDEGLYFFDWKHPARLITRIRSSLPKGNRPTICDVCETGGLHYVFYTDGMMRCWNRDSGQMLFERRVTTSTRGYRLRATRWDDRRLVVRTGEGLVLYDVATGQSRSICEDANVFDWEVTADGVCYVTREAVYKRNRQLDEPVMLLQANKDWQGVGVDWQGGVWACSFNDGVYYVASERGAALVQRIEMPAESDKLQRSMKSLLAYDANTLYMLTDNGFFCRKNGKVELVMAGISGNQLVRDSEGYIWIPTHYQGILRYDPRTGETANFSERAGFASNSNFCFEVRKGQMLVCAHNNELGRLNLNTAAYEKANQRNGLIYQFRYIVCACSMGKGILVGSQNGYFCYDYEKNQVDTIRTSQLNANRFSDKCNSLMRDKDGHIWIGTQYGLLEYDSQQGKVLHRYAENEGLTNCCIQAVAQDKQGVIWVSTAGGLAYKTPKSGAFHFILRNGDDMLSEGSFLERAVTETEDGRILWGTSDGIIELNPSVVFAEAHRLKPALMSFEVMGRTETDNVPQKRTLQYLDSTLHIRLSHTDNYVTLRFSTLNYAYPERTLYRYRLDGIDGGWVMSDAGLGGLTVSYPALPPGDYTLHVQATTFGNSWGPDLTLHITIAPPWWRSWWAVLLYVLVASALVIMGVRHYVRQRNAKLETIRRDEEQREHERLNEMKFRFFTNISHEFRTPLTLIITPLQTLLEQDNLPEGVAHTLGIIKRSAQTLNSLISQLLDFRSLEQGGEKLQPSVVQLGTIFDAIGPTFSQLAQERNMRFSIEKSDIEHATFHLDVPKFEKIVNNLLSNAFKFTPDGGAVSVKAHLEDNWLCLEVADTGVGMKAEELPHIFDRFYQAENKRQDSVLNTGSGIGLNLVSGYVHLMEGTIQVESQPKQGTTFRVRIPDLKSEVQATTADAAEAEIQPEQEETEAEKDQAVKLLVVEDNRDFRDFMVQALQSQYKVFSAPDGETALSTARVAVPDIIVSDVMMPRMDGYQLCKAVKEDIRLSHIPIVLLTAKNTDEGRTEGYLAGADSYITKPFNMSVLQACLTMLLDQRKERQREFEQEEDVNPQKLTISLLDEQFLQKAVGCMNQHMQDADYDVAAFSADMAMERTTLYRKMVAVIGKTPLQFMHSIRMKRGLQLVEAGQHSVSEIATMVGYNSTKSFSQHFKSTYGCYPSQYHQEKENAPRQEKK